MFGHFFDNSKSRLKTEESYKNPSSNNINPLNRSYSPRPFNQHNTESNTPSFSPYNYNNNKTQQKQTPTDTQNANQLSKLENRNNQINSIAQKMTNNNNNYLSHISNHIQSSRLGGQKNSRNLTPTISQLSKSNSNYMQNQYSYRQKSPVSSINNTTGQEMANRGKIKQNEQNKTNNNGKATQNIIEKTKNNYSKKYDQQKQTSIIDSFSQNPSLLDEGVSLAQNIPLSKAVIASKIPQENSSIKQYAKLSIQNMKHQTQQHFTETNYTSNSYTSSNNNTQLNLSNYNLLQNNHLNHSNNQSHLSKNALNLSNISNNTSNTQQNNNTNVIQSNMNNNNASQHGTPNNNNKFASTCRNFQKTVPYLNYSSQSSLKNMNLNQGTTNCNFNNISNNAIETKSPDRRVQSISNILNVKNMLNQQKVACHTPKNNTTDETFQNIKKFEDQQQQEKNVFRMKQQETGETFNSIDCVEKAKLQDTQQKLHIQQNLSNMGQTSPKNTPWQDWWSSKKKANSDLLLMAKINNTDICTDLLDKKKGDLKADVNSKGDDDWTALHYACQNGNTKLVTFLLYHEATIDSLNKCFQTPLIISSQKGYDDIFQVLVTAGADINHQDINGFTPLHYASNKGNKKIVEMLLRKPSLNYRLKNKKGQDAIEVALTIEIKKSFENFFTLQKKLMQSHQKVHIFQTKTDQIKKMFSQQNNQGIESLADSTNLNLSEKMKPVIPKNIHEQQHIASHHPENQQKKISTKQPELINKHSIEGSQKSMNSERSTNSDDNRDSLDNDEKIGPHSFHVHGLIGKGSFGEVYLVEKKNNQMLYAMKVLHKSKIMRSNLTRYAMTERNVLSVTKHPFIVKLDCAFQTQDKLFLILDYCPGGDLGEHLQKEKRFVEDRVKIYLAETILALEDLHKRDVIFRDLKPDNIVLDHEGHAMLTDFGLSKEGVGDHNTGARSFCGSVAYLAPEMLKRCGHGKAVDWYLLGVVMYELLVGIPPYYANNKEELFYNIEKAPLKLPSYLSSEAKSLLKNLLQRNPVKRLGSGKGDAEEIKAHKFFDNINWDDVFKRKLKPPIPNRKIRISTKYDPNIFETTQSFEDTGKEYIAGWSFVQPSTN